MDVKQAAPEVPGHRGSPGSIHSQDVVAVLQALSDPMRLAIVRRLSDGGECACGCFSLPIGKSTLTHHLQVLRAAGVIVQREEGTRRMTSLDRDGMSRRFPGLLEAVLAAPPQGPDHPAAARTDGEAATAYTS